MNRTFVCQLYHYLNQLSLANGTMSYGNWCLVFGECVYVYVYVNCVIKTNQRIRGNVCCSKHTFLELRMVFNTEAILLLTGILGQPTLVSLSSLLDFEDFAVAHFKWA